MFAPFVFCIHALSHDGQLTTKPVVSHREGLISVTLPLTFAPWELVYGDTDPLEALRRAWRLGDGFRVETFGYSFVAALAMFGLTLAGFLALCVGAVVAFPIAIALQHLVIGSLYLSLRSGSELPLPPEA